MHLIYNPVSLNRSCGNEQIGKYLFEFTLRSERTQRQMRVIKRETGADRTVLIICNLRRGMSPGKCVTAGKSGNSKKRGGEGGLTLTLTGRTSEVEAVWKSAAVTSDPLLSFSLWAAPFEPLKGGVVWEARRQLHPLLYSPRALSGKLRSPS